MNTFLIIGFLSSHIWDNVSAYVTTCTINTQDLSINQPLFVKPETNAFLFPNGNRKIVLNPGEQIQLYCEKSFKVDTKIQNLILTCGKDEINKYLECRERNFETARNTNKKCQYFRNDAYILEIGFNITNKFYNLMEICYNAAEERSIYSKNELGPYSGEFQMNVTREFFKEGDFHKNFNISRLYSKYIQTKTFEKLLGVTPTSLYLQDNSIVRGHLAAMADFIYAPHQLATFYYVNVAPQWYTFNSFNWVSLESNLRKFASKRNGNLEIYTGTYGTVELLSESNVMVPIYLYTEEKKNKVPIPKLFYKIIIDKNTKYGIVIIGINNPFASLEEIKEHYTICTDIQKQIKWLYLNDREDLKYGYMYACTVQEFVKTVQYMKFIKVGGILQE